jgi:uncharacterized protein YrrD
MFRNAKELKNYILRARDGDLGHLRDFYFDDQSWSVRYLAVETGTWLPSRKVLISPEAIRDALWDEQIFPVALTKEQVRHSPPIDSIKPVSRQYERLLREYYGWPAYWGVPVIPATIPPIPRSTPQSSPDANPHLFRANGVIGYRLRSSNGEIGHIVDLMIDDIAWKIRFLIVDAGTWLNGRQVLLATEKIRGIDWKAEQIVVDVDQNAVKNSPPYDPARNTTPEHVSQLQLHYERSAAVKDWWKPVKSSGFDQGAKTEPLVNPRKQTTQVNLWIGLSVLVFLLVAGIAVFSLWNAHQHEHSAPAPHPTQNSPD